MVWHGSPSRDQNGDVIPHDDPVRLPNSDHLVRHVPDIPGFQMLDENSGFQRATSAAFTFSTAGSKSMSADAYEELTDSGYAADHFARLAGKLGALVTIGAVRSHFITGPEPVAGNDYHCGIWQPCPPLGSSATKRACRELSRASRMI
jgi:hypothetical protein